MQCRSAESPTVIPSSLAVDFAGTVAVAVEAAALPFFLGVGVGLDIVSGTGVDIDDDGWIAGIGTVDSFGIVGRVLLDFESTSFSGGVLSGNRTPEYFADVYVVTVEYSR